MSKVMSEVICLVNGIQAAVRFGHILPLEVGSVSKLDNGWVLSVESDWDGVMPGVFLLLSHLVSGQHRRFEVTPGVSLDLPVCGVFFVVRAVTFCEGVPVRVVLEVSEQSAVKVG